MKKLCRKYRPLHCVENIDHCIVYVKIQEIVLNNSCVTLASVASHQYNQIQIENEDEVIFTCQSSRLEY